MRHLLCMTLLAALLLAPAPTIAAKRTSGKPHATAKKQLPIITTQQLKQKLDKHEKLTLIEALEPEYFAKGHLPGALQMTDTANAPKLLPDKKAEIVVYCMNTH